MSKEIYKETKALVQVANEKTASHRYEHEGKGRPELGDAVWIIYI